MDELEEVLQLMRDAMRRGRITSEMWEYHDPDTTTDSYEYTRYYTHPMRRTPFSL